MRLKLCILICLLLACPIGYGLTFKENIHVYGDGSVYARTNTADAKDLAMGSGDQTYKRVLNLEDDASSLQSSYLYNKDPSIISNVFNRYFAQASSAGGSEHMISVYSSSSINSQSKIDRVGNSLSTDYNIKSSNGDLSESVINSLGGHSRYIAEAALKGNFTLSSQLSEKVDVSRGFDAADLLTNLQSVDIKGSRGVEEDDTIEPPLMLIGGKEASDQDTAAILTKRGKDLAMSGNLDDLDKAIKLYDQALELDPENPVIWNNKGTALVRERKYEDALEAYDRALELNSEYSEAMIGKGSALNRLNRSAESIGLFEKAIGLDPSNAKAWNNKGVALTRLGRYDEAINAFDRAIEIDPEYEDAYFSRGKLFYTLQNYQEALNSLNRALELNPNDKEASVLKELAESALNQGPMP
ncbi:MAG: tetratricopeptide repeat protein [Methanothrix sp.]|nr:tetratricopeptide repeat protein [Methanothrix sp.]